MIKIGIIVDNITRGAGTERAVTSLCNGLIKFYPEIYQITIISIFSKHNKKSFFELNSNIKIFHLEKVNDFVIWNKFFWYNKLVNNLKDINNNCDFDIIIGTTYVHNILLPQIARNSKSKTIGCEHVVYNYPPKLFQIFRKLIYPKLHSLVVLNKTEENKFYFLKNTLVIPNCIPFENDKISTLNENKIISVGRLTHEKGIDILIDIYENIYKKAPNWELNIFGDGEDLEKLRTKVKQKGLEEYVKLRGSVKNISERYLESSIFVLCSRFESFGIVIIEAMNHGLPIISFDCEGPKNIINNDKSGFLISQFNLDEFSDNLLLLINNKEKRIQMGQTGLKESLNYKEKIIIPLWDKQIQSILKIRN